MIPGDSDLLFEITLLKVDDLYTQKSLLEQNIDPLLYSESQRLDLVKSINRQANDICEAK